MKSRCSIALLRSDQTGSILSLFSVILPAFLGIIALSVDIGLARWGRARLHTAADAGTLAGAGKILSGATVSEITAESAAVFAANSPSAVLVVNEAGHWSNGTFTIGGSINAVRIVAQTSTPTFFARVFNVMSVDERVESIAATGMATSADCLIPFGITSAALSGVNYGDLMNINANEPGNWGKLDLEGDNMSSAPVFYGAMASGVCSRHISIGDSVSPGTGNASVQNGFDARMAVNPIVVMAVVDAFPNGNSHMPVVQGFVVAELVAQENNGTRWTGYVRIISAFGGHTIGNTPPGAPYAWSRSLVR